MLESVRDSKAAAERSDEGHTIHNYGKAEDDSVGPIDYVFVTQGVKVEAYKIIRNTVKGMYPSDHYPIMADVII